MTETLSSMLICLMVRAAAKVIDWPEIDNWDTSQGLLGIHLDSKMPEAQIWLENKSGDGISY